MTAHLSRRAAALMITTGLTMTMVAGLPHTAWADEAIDARHVVDKAVITLDEVRQQLKSSSDMEAYLAQAKGVLIIPSYYKAGFILGGAYGDGVLLTRLPEGGFGDPAFYRMTGGSIGLQIGMNSAQTVFIILTEKGLNSVMTDEFKLGANVSMSIFTVGAGAEAATTTHVGQDIVAYSKTAGLFAGGSFEGAVIRPRKDWNAAVYGVGNDNPQAIVQRNQLRVASGLKDALAKGSAPAEAPAAPPPAPQF